MSFRKHFQDFKYFCADILFPLFVAILFFCLVIFLLYPLMKEKDNQLIEQGRYYATQCQVLEKNIDKGFWSARENMLQCGETREHVSVETYDKALKAWRKAQRRSNN